MARGRIDLASKPIQTPIRLNNTYFIRRTGSKIFSNAEIEVVASKQSKTSRKRVRFAVNHNNDVREEVLFLRPPMTDEEIDLAWWSHLEYKIIRAEARESCEYGLRRESLSRYMTEYAQIFTSCMGMGPTEEEKQRFFQSHDDDRGLEDYYVPFLSRDRRRAVYGVLAAQSKLRTSIDFDVRDRLLSATSRHLSRSSRLLATILGEADAIAAKSIERACFEKPSQP